MLANLCPNWFANLVRTLSTVNDSATQAGILINQLQVLIMTTSRAAGQGGPVIVTAVNSSRIRSNLTVDHRPGGDRGPSAPLVPPDTTQERRPATGPPGLALPDPAQSSLSLVKQKQEIPLAKEV